MAITLSQFIKDASVINNKIDVKLEIAFIKSRKWSCWEQQSSLTPFRDLYLLPHSVGVFTRVAKFLGSSEACC